MLGGIWQPCGRAWCFLGGCSVSRSVETLNTVCQKSPGFGGDRGTMLGEKAKLGGSAEPGLFVTAGDLIRWSPAGSFGGRVGLLEPKRRRQST